MMSMILILASLFGGFGTFELTHRLSLSNIRSSSLITISAYFILKFTVNLEVELLHLIATAVFGGSFVGMSSNHILNRLELLFASLFFGILFILLIPHLAGLGGALGISAFVSVFLIKCLTKINCIFSLK